MANVFSRSWAITKISFGVIKKDKELLIYPLLSGIFSLIFSIAMLFPKIIYVLIQSGVPEDINTLMGPLEYVLVFLTYLGLALIATFFNVCVVYTTKTRFEGGNATLGSSFKFALSKFHLIFAWSLLSATVGLLLYILDQLASQLKGAGEVILRLIRGAISIAWSIVTIFVIPGLVYYGLGPKDAIKKSVKTLQKTWGESLVRHFGMGLIQFIFFLLGVAIGIGVGFLTIGVLQLGLVGILITAGVVVIYFLILVLTFSVANSVYNTALFVYADTGKIPEGFSKDIMSGAFKQKKIATR